MKGSVVGFFSMVSLAVVLLIWELLGAVAPQMKGVRKFHIIMQLDQ